MLLYTLKAGGCLIAFFFCYRLLLGRDTCYRIRRILLCGMLPLSLLLPLCVVTVERELPAAARPVSPSPMIGPAERMEMLPSAPDVARPALPVLEVEEPLFDRYTLLFALYFAGVCFVLGRLLWNAVAIWRLVRRGERCRLEEGSCLVLLDRPQTPFSWMRYAVLSREDWERDGAMILLHERAHVRLHHSCDLLAVDLLGCLQWLNPAMWLLRRELRAVHEFQADEAVLRSGADARDYQMLLIRKAVGGRWCSVANSLNHSNLKKRITMMLRKKSSRWAGAKALYVLPLTCLALGAFARTSYVLPKDKGMKKSGKTILSRSVGSAASVPESPTELSPAAVERLQALFAELERAAERPKGSCTITGRVSDGAGRPIEGFELLCGALQPVVTDAEGGFTVSDVTGGVAWYYFNRGELAGALGFGGLDCDLHFDVRLDGCLELTTSVPGPRGIIYRTDGAPSDFRFDPVHLPLLLWNGQEVAPEVLCDTLAHCAEREQANELFARVVKDPELLAVYGEKSADGVVQFYFGSYGGRHRWGRSDSSAWSRDDMQLCLVLGEEIPDGLLPLFDRSVRLAVERYAAKCADDPAVSVIASEEGLTTTFLFAEDADPVRLIPRFEAEQALWLLDGEPIGQFQLFGISSREIASVTLLRREEAVKRYGRRGRMGVVELTSRPLAGESGEAGPKPDPFHWLEGDFEPLPGQPDTYRVSKLGLRRVEPWRTGCFPLTLWDGRIVDFRMLGNPGAADHIASIRIVPAPGGRVFETYGPAACNGVVCVISRYAGREEDDEPTVYDAKNHPFRYLKGEFVSVDGKNTFKVRKLGLRNLKRADPFSLPLVLVDDRPVSLLTLERISERDIEAVQVFAREEVAREAGELSERYGSRAAGGVVRVVLRKSSRTAKRLAAAEGNHED